MHLLPTSLPMTPMPPSSVAARAASDGSECPLEHCLSAVEYRLGTLGEALRQLDVPSIDRQAGELHRALARAVAQFSDAAQQGPVALALRRRLARASGEVAAQRNALALATAALDRAIDTLLPPNHPYEVSEAERSD